VIPQHARSPIANQLYLQPRTAPSTLSPKNIRKTTGSLPPIEQNVGAQKATLLRATLKSLVANKVRLWHWSSSFFHSQHVAPHMGVLCRRLSFRTRRSLRGQMCLLWATWFPQGLRWEDVVMKVSTWHAADHTYTCGTVYSHGEEENSALKQCWRWSRRHHVLHACRW